MERTKKNIKEKIIGIVEKNNFLLVDLVIRGNERNPVVEIYIDGDKPVTANDCSKLSRKITSLIDDEELLTGNYRLDVSSPGIDKPLKFLRQYPKHINRSFEVKYLENDVKKKFEGELIDIEGDILTFRTNKGEVKLNFNQIQKAKVIIRF